MLKIKDSISSISGNALISRWTKAHGLERTENPSNFDEDEDELIKLELSELEEPDEQLIKISDDEDEPNLSKKSIKLNQTSITRFLS